MLRISVSRSPDVWQDYYYVRRRNRFFVGEISRQWSTFVSRFDPPYSGASRALLRQTWDIRKSGVFQFYLLDRLHPDLATLPFDTPRYNDVYLALRDAPVVREFSSQDLPRYNGWTTPLSLNHGREFKVIPSTDQAALARKLRAPVQQVVLLPTVRRETHSMLAELSMEERTSTFDMEGISLLGRRAERHAWSLRSLFVIHSALLWYLDKGADERP